MGATLAECTALTDIAFYAWLAAITTASVLEQHMVDAARQLQRRHIALAGHRQVSMPAGGTGHAA